MYNQFNDVLKLNYHLNWIKTLDSVSIKTITFKNLYSKHFCLLFFQMKMFWKTLKFRSNIFYQIKEQVEVQEKHFITEKNKLKKTSKQNKKKIRIKFWILKSFRFQSCEILKLKKNLYLKMFRKLKFKKLSKLKV